jgi:hypothetical protein
VAYGTISVQTRVLGVSLPSRCLNRKRRLNVKVSKTSKYYEENPEAAEKRREYQRKYNKSEDRKKYRALLNKYNREQGTYGNGDGLDASHTKTGKLVMEAASKNRARNRGKK